MKKNAPRRTGVTSRILGDGPKWRSALMLGLVAAAPPLFIRTLNDPFNIPKLTLLILVLSVVLGLRLFDISQGGSPSGLRWLSAPGLALSVPLIVGWLATPYKGWALWGNYPRFLGLVPYLVTVLFGVLLVDACRREILRLAWALVGGGALVGAYAIVQVVGLDPLTWGAERVAASSMGNPNFTGAFLGMCLPVGLGLAAHDRVRNRAAFGFLLPIVGGWVVAQSAGGWAAGLAGSFVVGGALLSRRWDRARIVGLVCAGAFACLAVGAVIWTMAGPEGERGLATAARRGDWWAGAARMAAEHPLVGRGPGVFGLEGPRFRTEEDARQSFDFTDDPHSLPLTFLTSGGVLGLAGLAIGAGWLMKEGSRLPAGESLGQGFFGGVVAYLLQALVSIDTVGLRVGFWAVAAGLVISRLDSGASDPPPAVTKTRRSSQPAPARVPAAIAGPVLALLAAAGIWWGVRFAVADATILHAVHLLQEGRGDEALRTFDEALAFRDEPHYRRVKANQLGRITLALAEQGSESLAEHFFEETEQAWAYTQHLPHAGAAIDHARFLYAWSLRHPERREEAIALFERAVELDPQNPGLRLEAAEASESLNQSE